MSVCSFAFLLKILWKTLVKKVDIFYIIAFSVLRAFLGVLKLDGYLFIGSFRLAFSAKLGSNRGNYFSHFLHC